MRNAFKFACILFLNFFLTGTLYGADMRIPSPSSPEENQNISSQDPCDGTSANEQGECAYRKFKETDKRLNDLYKQLMARLSGTAKSSLVTEQKAWIKFKDSFCTDYGQDGGGAQTWKSTFTVICWNSVTKIRANEIEAYLEFLKND